jgi:hypothetical protein
MRAKLKARGQASSVCAFGVVLTWRQSENPGISVPEMGKLLGERWKTASAEDKQVCLFRNFMSMKAQKLTGIAEVHHHGRSGQEALSAANEGV